MYVLINSRASEGDRRLSCNVQVLVVGWVVATVYFLICYTAPCRALPSGQVPRYPSLPADRITETAMLANAGLPGAFLCDSVHRHGCGRSDVYM